MARTVPVSAVETPEFLPAARKLMGAEEQADLSQQDRNGFRQLTALLVEAFKRREP